MTPRLLFATVLLFAVIAPLRPADEKPAPRPIQLPDILAWKRIALPQASPDGAWFAYRLSPNEGDSEVILRDVRNAKDLRFPIGELPTPGAGAPPAGGGRGGVGGPPADLAISDDSKWAAFLAYPTAREAKALKRQRRPAQSRLVLVELGTGKKTEFEKIRRFAFSGERASMLAMLRYAPTPAGPAGAGAGAPAATPPTPAAGAGTASAAEERVTGADMLLYDLATSNELNFGNVAEFSFDKKGSWLAWIVDAQDKAGNGVQVMNVAAGAILPLDSSKASYRGLSWTEKGDGLATVRGVDDKAWEDKLYTLVAFRFTGNGAPEKIVYDPSKDASFPKDMSIAAARNASWNTDLTAVAFGIHELKPKKTPPGRGGATAAPPAENTTENASATPPRPDDPATPDMVIWHWKDKRLQSMQQVQEAADKNFSYACLYRPAEKKFIRLADEALRQVNLNAEAKFGIGFDVRDYELGANLDGQRYEDAYAVDLKTGDRKLLLKKAQWVNAPSPDASHLLYYNDGAFFTYDLTTGQTFNITKSVPSVFYNTEDDHNMVKPPTPVVGWSKDSAYVLLSDEWDVWKVPAHGGAAVNLTGNGKKDKIRYRTRLRFDPEERGIDLSKPLYFTAYGEWTKKGGVLRVEPGQSGGKILHWDDAAYGAVIKAKRAEVYFYTRETTQDYPNYHAAGPSLEDSPILTDANPQQKDFLWSKGVRIVDYTSAKGDKLQGALYLPANYEPGKSYPTMVYIYEKLSQSANTYSHPAFNGFNIAAYTSNGYAVLTPDIVYKINDPGMSAVWCILPALKAAVATGVVDEKKVGLHGHSWGGYQTAFMVTQTGAFHAAIAGAPLTDMVSMYSSIYWNSGSANQPIFESSQGRFTSGYWDNTDAYVRNSPVYHAKSVNTPLIILHNDKDGAVDWTQGIEYYNTLRRLGKQVVLLQYKGENHGLRKPENMKDYTIRMKEFFDYQLKGNEPPKWWLEGVPLLKMKDHLDEREKLLPKPSGVGAMQER